MEAVLEAEKVTPRAFEDVKYFEGCLPIEVMAQRGMRTLAFGPMKPVGLTDPRTGRWPYAVVQLRAEDVDRSAYNLVGFQTRMKHADQKRVFSLIPGLENVELLRYGSVHRNTFVDSPRALEDDLSLRGLPGVHLAGQVSGVEGYVESAACGLVLGVLLATGALPPETTALGSLYRHLRRVPEGKQAFQPSNIVFSMFPSLYEGSSVTDAVIVTTESGKRRKLGKRERGEALSARALAELEPWLDRVGARDVLARMPPPPGDRSAGLASAS